MDESVPRERLVRIYADGNSRDEQGRYCLNVVGSLVDLERHKDVLRPGLRVIINDMNELEFEATLVFDGIWYAVPIEGTTRYLDEISAEVL